jgi:hypothetical protein
MKSTFTYFLLTLLSLGLGSCMTMHEGIVESDYSYRGNFRRYRTFAFMTGGGLTSDSSRLGAALRSAIQQRLRAQGYKPARNRADLLVSFRVFEGDMRFQGFAQEDFSRWLKNETVEDENTPASQRQGYEPMRLLMTDGTLLLTLIDVNTQRAVWNGYASGVTVPEGPMGEIVLRRSVRSILDRYHVFTEGYLNGTARDDTRDGN